MDEVAVLKSVSDEDLELINKLSIKKLTAEDVFTFSVILCDNEIDRDFEVFSDDSLESLKTLFVGKTGILNHSNRSEDQSSRTYKTELIEDSTRKTSYGENYKYLKAWCYTVKSSKNEDFIKDIESGIKKEVSVSCNYSEKVCSVCGESICNHRAGKYYGDTLCYKELCGVTDAYEWSFVAVPAQRSAGVTKSAKREKAKERAEKAKTEKELEFTKLYRTVLKEKSKKGFAILLPELKGETVEDILNLLPIDVLTDISLAFEENTRKMFPAISQYSRAQKNDENNQFKI